MNCVIDADGDLGAVYLGNIDAANNVNYLKKHNIKAVMTVASDTGVRYNEQIIPYHEVIYVDDYPWQNLSQYFDQMYNFIEKARKKTNILIHCFAGVSRSASAVIMYLMRKYKYTFEKGFQQCRSKRTVTNPNPGFIRQLLDYEKLLIEQKQFKQQPSQNLLNNYQQQSNNVLKNRNSNYNSINLDVKAQSQFRPVNSSGRLDLQKSTIQTPQYGASFANENTNFKHIQYQQIPSQLYASNRQPTFVSQYSPANQNLQYSRVSQPVIQQPIQPLQYSRIDHNPYGNARPTYRYY